MTTTNVDIAGRSATSTPRTILTAGLAVLAAAATAIYGAYGDPSPSAEQEHGVPLIIGVDIVLALLIFGLLATWAGRSASRAAAWGLGLSVVGLVAIPIVFWSGIVIVVASAGVLLGVRARRSASAIGRRTGLATSAVAVGVIALVLSTVLLILGNTVLA